MRGGAGRRAARLAALAVLLLLAPVARGFDADADGVGDGADDCRELANPDQRDTDQDGFGNACDPDFDQDGVVGWRDQLAIEQAFGATQDDPRYNARLDLDGDGAIGVHEHLETSRRFGSPPGPSGLTCAGEVPCQAGLVRIDAAEAVLSQSARLVWRAASPAVVFDVERRAPGGVFEPAGRVWGRESDFVDRGAAGRGLAPGTYEYRVRGGGAWSAPRAVTIREECAGQPPTSPLLPVVVIADHEPDGDHDGEDVAAALAECSRLRGCVLRGLPVTYQDVNAELALYTGYDFSRGLVVEGYGSATVFRSRVFSDRDHEPGLCADGAAPPCYRPRAVFSILQPGATRLDGVRFRNFHIEGRKREQPDPGMDVNGWEHWGIVVIAHTPESTDGGCVHNVTASELMTGGFGVHHGNGWILENSSVHDVGCQADLTPCDALLRTPEYLSIPGFQAPAHAFLTGSFTEGTVMRNNRAVRATKYGIAAVFGASGFHFHDNVVEAGGGAGIECSSCGAGVIERNLVRSMHYPSGRNAAWPDGFGGELAAGIQCGGPGHDVSIQDNLVISGEGSGIRIQCAGPNLLVRGNAIVGNCGKGGQSLVVGDGEGAVVTDNVVSDHPGGCRYSVLVAGARDARIEGTKIDSGPGTAAGMLVVGTAQAPTTGLVLRDLQLSARGASGVGIYLAPTSSGTTFYDSVCSSGFPTPFVDASAGGTIRPADPAGACTGDSSP